MKLKHFCIFILVAWAPWMMGMAGGWAGSVDNGIGADGKIYFGGVQIGALSADGLQVDAIQSDTYQSADGEDMMKDNSGDLQLFAPGGAATDYISMICEGTAERFRFYQSGTSTDIDACLGFFDDDEGPETICWDDGVDLFEISDQTVATIFKATDAIRFETATNLNNATFMTAVTGAGYSVPTFNNGLILDEMTAPSNPASDLAHMFLDGADGDQKTIFDSGAAQTVASHP